jgi:hypothetical protein
VFIVVELLFAVRTTVAKRELVAEPFLLVGIIASIKEIVVLSVEAAGALGQGAEFDDRVVEIGLLGVLVVVLGVTSFLLRRKSDNPTKVNPSRGGAATDGGAGLLRSTARGEGQGWTGRSRCSWVAT